MIDRMLSIGAGITSLMIFANVFMFTGGMKADMKNTKDDVKEIKAQQNEMFKMLYDLHKSKDLS